MFAELSGKRVLLLQGPVGPFFRRLSRELEAHAAHVMKVNFNPGDWLYFHGHQAVSYRDGCDDFAPWLRERMTLWRVDLVFLFGDQRPYHRVAREVARELGVDIYVFEEGYLRPNHITLERGGANGNSSLPRDPDLYRRVEPIPPRPVSPVRAGFWFLALHSAGYSVAFTLFGWLFPRYQHHKDIHLLREAFRWGRGAVRKWLWSRRDRGALERITREWGGRHFLVPLQVHSDQQLQHSRYASVAEFVTQVVESFAAHAPSDCALVVKHHPMDRPFTDYTRSLSELRRRHGLGARLIYVADTDIAGLLSHARGAVVMNSTVGLQALEHGTPLKVLGRAFYDMRGLSFQGELSDFWRAPGTVDLDLHQRFHSFLEQSTQANGSFYRRLPDEDLGPTGVRWWSAAAGAPTPFGPRMAASSHEPLALGSHAQEQDDALARSQSQAAD